MKDLSKTSTCMDTENRKGEWASWINIIIIIIVIVIVIIVIIIKTVDNVTLDGLPPPDNFYVTSRKKKMRDPAV